MFKIRDYLKYSLVIAIQFVVNFSIFRETAQSIGKLAQDVALSCTRQWDNLINRIDKVRVKRVTSDRIDCFVQFLGRFVEKFYHFSVSFSVLP